MYVLMCSLWLTHLHFLLAAGAPVAAVMEINTAACELDGEGGMFLCICDIFAMYH
jgi:hypothetical protein